MVTIGINASGRVRGLEEFSLSDRRYGTFALTATLSASYIGGGFSIGNAAKSAELGIGNMAALLAFSLSAMAIGAFVVPRMRGVRGAGSAGDVIRIKYGPKAGALAGIAGFLFCAGLAGAQAAAIGQMFSVFLGLSHTAGILAGTALLLLYSTVGGMKALVATDIVQFSVLAVGMPLLLRFTVNAAGGAAAAAEGLPAAYLSPLNGTTLPAFASTALMFALGEALSPPYVSRLLMGRDLKTTSRATVLSGAISIPFFIVTGCVGLGAYVALGPSADPDTIMQTSIRLLVPAGFRGVIIAGMLAVVMSSADSYLNSAAVSLVKDVIVPLSGGISEAQGLLLARMANLAVGAAAAAFALAAPGVLEALFTAYIFWSPTVLVPLTAALMGVSTGSRAFFASFIAGGAAATLWKLFLRDPLGIDGCVVGAAASLAAFLLWRNKG